LALQVDLLQLKSSSKYTPDMTFKSRTRIIAKLVVAALVAVNLIGAQTATAETYAVTAPSAPVYPVVSVMQNIVTGSAAQLSWEAPLKGAADVTDYEIRYSSDVGVTWQTVSRSASQGLTASVFPLTPGATYVFQMRSISPGSSSAWVTASNGTTNPTPTATLTSISAGFGYFCAVNTKGRVLCWGANSGGQLGLGYTSTNEPPTELFGITTAVQVSSGDYSSCVLLANGNVKCWGGGADNLLGTGNTNNSASPVDVVGVSNATQIAVGLSQACALIQTGEIKCWGSPSFGGLGNGDRFTANQTVTVSGIDDAIQIAITNSTVCALLAGGQVKCWGGGFYGQLGNGSDEVATTPQTVLDVSGAVSISGANNTFCARLGSGIVKCWGHNDAGQIQGNAVAQTNTPLSVNVAALSPQVFVGDRNVCLIRIAGINCYGDNISGQLGIGDFNASSDVRPPTGVTAILDMAISAYTMCAIEADAELKCWGNNSSNQIDQSGSSVLIPATTYGFTSHAITISEASAPSRPTGIKVVATGKGKSRISWNTAGYQGEAITGWEYRIRLSAVKKWGAWKSVGIASSVTVPRLKRNQKYSVQIRVTNNVGQTLSSVVKFKQKR
jgi:alpha-tubulin suppressor-like RCC1 family protein